MHSSTTSSYPSASPSMQSHQILVVGVNEVDEMLLRYILEEQGGHMHMATTGLDALDKVKATPVDLVIMNTNLSDQNALELVKKLRQTGNQTLPIVGITAQDAESRSLFQGFNYIIHRPIEKQKVLRALRQHLPTGDQ